MKWFEKIFNRLNGLHYRQEYLCLDSDSFQHPLHAWLVHEERTVRDITLNHLFVGYHPLIFAFSSSPETEPRQLQTIDIFFTDKTLHPNEKISPKDAIARLSLKKIREQPAGNNSILYFEGISGTHRFISAFHQWIIRLNNRLANKKAGNVFLDNSLYSQVQVAYSLPRNISLITIGEDNKYNLFPTDLHGAAGAHHYIISLRREGKACLQVMRARKILVTQVQSSFYKTVYALGKNHMKEPKDRSLFPLSERDSDQYKLPIPEAANVYRELELQETFEHGIHNLLLFKIISTQRVQPDPSRLAHIHNVCATWRHNNRLPGNYLLR